MTYNVYHTGVKYFDWNESKNEWLIENRGISFEMCVSAINEGRVLAIDGNKPPREHQKKYVLEIRGYAYVVPYVQDDEKIFLKTAYPSRKVTKLYLKNKDEKR